MMSATSTGNAGDEKIGYTYVIITTDNVSDCTILYNGSNPHDHSKIFAD